MSVSLSYSKEGDILYASLSGEWETKLLNKAADELAQYAKESGDKYILIDSRGMSAPSSEFSKYQIGEHLAKVWGAPISLYVCILYREKHISKLLENSAVNKGANIVVLSDYDQALDWLNDKIRLTTSSI